MKQKICIVGNGLTGLTSALILGDLNIKIDLIHSNNNRQTRDNRTTALSASNYNLLLRFLGKKYSTLFWPSRKVDLFYQSGNMYKHFINFEKKDENLMFIYENKKIREIILRKIKKNKNIRIVKGKVKSLDSKNSAVSVGNKKIYYDSILLCVGKNSKLPNIFIGERYLYDDNNEVALTAVIKHNHKITNVRQYFLNEGPLAILPINKSKFSLIWTVKKSLNLTNPKVFVEKKLNNIFKLKRKLFISKLNFFPISFKFNTNISKKNILVLGESSYNIHPIAGQGYNLILRDIETLHKEMKKNLENGIQIKDSKIFINFVNLRKPENLLFGIGISAINRFFMYNQYTQPFKDLILKDINKFKFLKDVGLNLSNHGIYTKI